MRACAGVRSPTSPRSALSALPLSAAATRSTMRARSLRLFGVCMPELVSWLEPRDLAVIFSGLVAVFGVGFLVGVNL